MNTFLVQKCCQSQPDEINIYRHVAFISVNEDLQESDNEKSYKSPLIFQDLSIWWMFTSRSIPPDQTLPHEIRLVIAYEDSK